MRHPARPVGRRGTRGDRALSRFGRGPRIWTSSAALTVLSAAVAVAAGCGGGGTATGPTEAVAPDRLAVTLSGGGGPDLRFDLECAVADRQACADVLAAIAEAEADDTCEPAPDEGDAAIAVRGTISGDRVSARIDRRTTCQIRAYDDVITGLGLN